LLTGGLGYIGSHTSITLANEGFDILILDNLSNSRISVLDSIQKISNKKFHFIHSDIRNTETLRDVFQKNKIDLVVHLAGLKSVYESILNPIEYFSNNVEGTLSLLKVMQDMNVKNLVFSSSATVYGNPKLLPINEEHPLDAINPYGRTKLHIEQILKDLATSDDGWSIICLRYFNPVGAHESLLIGENPIGIPSNLMPYITKVAYKEIDFLNVFGGDYETPDGSAIRDYIHVMDLAEGHLAAACELKKLKGFTTFNLGTGKGLSVFNLIEIYEKVNTCKIPFKITSRRDGDVAISYAEVLKAKKILKWKSRRTWEDMCKSAFQWHANLRAR
jgi:UDP-glucose 4-epimerase